VQNEIERPEGEDAVLSEALEENHLRIRVNSCPPQPPKKMDTEEQRLEKKNELFTGCSNKALNDMC